MDQVGRRGKSDNQQNHNQGMNKAYARRLQQKVSQIMTKITCLFSQIRPDSADSHQGLSCGE